MNNDNLNIFFLLIFMSFLCLLNYLLTKNKKLIHLSNNEKHKKFGLNQVPLSGGLFFFSVIVYLNLQDNYINYGNIFFIFCYLFLGIIIDLNYEINSKIRLCLQILFTTIFVTYSEILINKSNIFFLDYLLNNFFFNIFFTSFCILIILNGLNFMDGVNNNVIGFCLLVVISINFIEQKNFFTHNLFYYKIFLIALISFYILNAFNQNYLGDSGIYVISITLSLMVISFVNKSNYVSPFLAVNFLWYPAFETFFSIIRKLISNKNPFLADTSHLHTLILKFLSFNGIKIKNTLSGLILNIVLIPNFLISVFYYNNSKILIFTTIIYLFLYVLTYLRLSKYDNLYSKK